MSTNVCRNPKTPRVASEVVESAFGSSSNSITLANPRGMDFSATPIIRMAAMSSSSLTPFSRAVESNSVATTNEMVTLKSVDKLPMALPAETSMCSDRGADNPTLDWRLTVSRPCPAFSAFDRRRSSGGSGSSSEDAPFFQEATPFFAHTHLDKVDYAALRREVVILSNPLWQCELRRIPIVVDHTDHHAPAAFVIGFSLRDILATGPRYARRDNLARFLSGQASALLGSYVSGWGTDLAGLYLSVRGQVRHRHYGANGGGKTGAGWSDAAVYGVAVMILAMCTFLSLNAHATAHVTLHVLPMLQNALAILEGWPYETNTGRDLSEQFRSTEVRCLQRVIASVQHAEQAAINLAPKETLNCILRAGYEAIIPPVVLDAGTHARVLRKLSRGQLLRTPIPGRNLCDALEQSDTQSTLAVEGYNDADGNERSCDQKGARDAAILTNAQGLQGLHTLADLVDPVHSNCKRVKTRHDEDVTSVVAAALF